MSSFFGNMSTEGMEETGDRLGGGGAPLPADVYKAKIVMAYGIQSDGGAKGVVLHMDLDILDENGNRKDSREYRETIYITKRSGENFYEKDGKKYPMPGFQTVEDICILAHPENKGLGGQTVEERHVPVWDKDAKKEVPRAVPVITSLLDRELYVALQHIKETKQVNQNGQYVDDPQGGTRESNKIDKAFHVQSKQTVSEAKAGQNATFLDAWVKKNKGTVIDNTTKGGGKAGAPGAKPVAGSSGTQSVAGLFNKPGA